MALLLNANGLAKRYGPEPLFINISINISESDRLGLVGPNGSGKSTLLEILAGRREPDAGELAIRKGVRLAYVAQVSEFESGETIGSIVQDALRQSGMPEGEQTRHAAETLGRAGFEDTSLLAASLSGGWRKRLALVQAMLAKPDILLLDEPTNHLDLAGITWLETFLRNSPFACVVVSHDRYFLENVATAMAELNRIYPDGLLRVRGNYSTFLEKKSEFLAAQAKRQESLENRVRTEIAWLRRGPKARATKAKARIDNAKELIDELSSLNARRRTAEADIDFTASERATKRLVTLENVSFSFDERAIVKELDFAIAAGMRVGLVGPNGSGKTTLLRLIRDEIAPQAGEVLRANNLRAVYFEQNRPLDDNLTLRQALAPDGDAVIYQERTIHVASWASRFLFSSEQLNQPVGRLSGGERARVSIAKLMLEPADLLLLDEPTNDLDIPTLEILEENLIQFRGALVLVTHDRYLLDRVSTVILGLDGKGSWGRFAEYSQWEQWMAEAAKASSRASQSPALRKTPDADRGPARKKLSYLDSRDFETIESRIAEAEQVLMTRRAALEDADVVRDSRLLQQALQQMEEAEQKVDGLYARWAELEEKLTGAI